MADKPPPAPPVAPPAATARSAPAPGALSAIVWHALASPEDVYAAAGTTERGLTKADAADRLTKYGPNAMTPGKTRTIWRLLWEQFNVIIYILLAAAIISGAYQDWIELGLILGVVVVNVLLGAYQENSAEKATQAIRNMAKATALALRNGKRVQLDAAALVPGDVVFLQAGDRVPADVRWVDVSSLQVTEAMLTGESAPVTKTTAAVEADAPLGDRLCMGYTGTLVFTGQGTAVVTATGDGAEIGKLNKLMTTTEVAKTPLLHQIEVFGRGLSALCILVAIGTFLLAWFGRGYSAQEALKIGVGVAVALIPEGLPTVVTITLALGVTAMARQNAIIRQLPAVETLGSVSVICSDKTGTLTKNEMTAVGVHTAGGGTYRVTGSGYNPDGDVKAGEDPIPGAVRGALRQLLLPAVLCNDSTLMPTVSAHAQTMLATQVISVPVPESVPAAAASGAQAAAPTPITYGPPVGTTALAPAPAPAGGDAPAAVTAADGSAAAAPAPADAASGGRKLVSTQQASLRILGLPDAPAPAAVDTAVAVAGTPAAPDAAAPPMSEIARQESAIARAGAQAAAAALRRVEWNTTGDPTEAALLALGMKAGLNLRTINALCLACPRLDTVPFSSDVKFMATAHDLLLPTSGSGSGLAMQRVLLVKGAPDVLLPRCASQAGSLGDGGAAGPADPWAPQPLQLERWLRTAAELSSEGLRVLALCSLRVPATQDAFSTADVLHGAPRLHLHCLVSIVDPPRDEAVTAIKQAHSAGVVVKMITGDHADTAKTIGGWIGIGSEEVLTGAQVAAMDDATLSTRVEGCHIYARMSPEQKLRIVQALYRHGHVVAMTGDGVNDAPALKAASVGVAMGITGTEVAKEASKMILADDNFATIVAAVRRGRGVYDNLRKLMMFILPTSVAQGLGLTAAMVIGVPEPLTIIQLLYVNVVTAISLGLVLAVEEPEPDVMNRPPRPQGKQLVGKLIAWRSLFVGFCLIIAIIGNQQWTLDTGGTVAEGHTMALNTLVVAQCLYCLSCRYLSQSSLRLEALYTNPWLTAMILLTGALQCLITYTPGIQQVFSTAPIGGLEWLRILGFAVVIFLLVELEKWAKPARYIIPPLRRLFAKCACCACSGGCCRRGPPAPRRGSSHHGLGTPGGTVSSEGAAPAVASDAPAIRPPGPALAAEPDNKPATEAV